MSEDVGVFLDSVALEGASNLSSTLFRAIVVRKDGKRIALNLPFCASKEEAAALIESSKASLIAKADQLLNGITSEVVNAILNGDKRMNVLDAISEYSKHLASSGRSTKSVHNALDAVKRWAKKMEIFNERLCDLNSEHINAYINDSASELKRTTRETVLGHIRSFLEFCKTIRIRLDNPAATVSVRLADMTHEQREVKHKSMCSDQEYEKLVKFAEEPRLQSEAFDNDFFFIAIQLSRECGLRGGDICMLEHTCIDYVSRTLTLWMEKTSKRISIPLTPNCLALLAKASMRNQGQKYIFPKAAEIASTPTRRALFSTAFKAIVKRAGCDKAITFHSLRVACATSMALDGATIEEIKEKLGHSDSRTTRDYVRRQGAADKTLAI